MAAAVGCGSATSSWAQFVGSAVQRNAKSSDKKRFRVSCAASASRDPYKTLQINRGASESEVKKAFRRLALQYHPDVCKGSNCGVQFHQINEAYNIVMSHVRSKSRVPKRRTKTADDDEKRRIRYAPDDLWEEWMGWEGGGIRDYSSHINPYI